jgi:hypothetical protein
MENRSPSTSRVLKTGYHRPSEFGKQVSLQVTRHHQSMEKTGLPPPPVWKTGLPPTPEYEKQFKIATTRVNTTEPEFVNV